MDWKLIRIEKETNHPFLNHFVFRYEVNKGSGVTEYPYYVASRREVGELQAETRQYEADGVVVLALTEEKDPSLLLIKVFRPALNDYVIEFPAGLVDRNDTSPLQTAIRETEEETGFILKDARLFCPPSPTSSGLSDELVTIVEGRVDEKAVASLEEYEDIEYRFVKLSKIKEYFAFSGKLVALNVRLLVEYLLERYRA